MNAQGEGSHGVNTEGGPGGGPDALFSQGAVKASAEAKMLATVNVSPSAQVFFISTISGISGGLQHGLTLLDQS